MDLAPLRALARDVEFGVHGVPATVGGVPTRVIWLTEQTEQDPPTNELQRASSRRALAIRRDDIPTSPARGTVIDVEAQGFVPASSWVVDSTAELFSDHTRVMVLPSP